MCDYQLLCAGWLPLKPFNQYYNTIGKLANILEQLAEVNLVTNPLESKYSQTFWRVDN